MPLPNETVTVDLDKPRHLLYDFNALVLAEEMLGVNLLAGGEMVLNRLSFTQVRTLLFCGLLHEDPDLTERQVGSWLVGYSAVKTVGELIGKAIAGAMPDPEPSEVKEPTPFGGSTAGPSGSTTSGSPKKASGG